MAENAIGDFKQSGSWASAVRDCDPSQIRAEDFTSSALDPSCLFTLPATRSVSSISKNSSMALRIEKYNQLIDPFSRRSGELILDYIVDEGGSISISTTSGATLTLNNVLDALRKRQEHNALREKRRAKFH